MSEYITEEEESPDETEDKNKNTETDKLKRKQLTKLKTSTKTLKPERNQSMKLKTSKKTRKPVPCFCSCLQFHPGFRVVVFVFSFISCFLFFCYVLRQRYSHLINKQRNTDDLFSPTGPYRTQTKFSGRQTQEDTWLRVKVCERELFLTQMLVWQRTCGVSSGVPFSWEGGRLLIDTPLIHLLLNGLDWRHPPLLYSGKKMYKE